MHIIVECCEYAKCCSAMWCCRILWKIPFKVAQVADSLSKISTKPFVQLFDEFRIAVEQRNSLLCDGPCKLEIVIAQRKDRLGVSSRVKCTFESGIDFTFFWHGVQCLTLPAAEASFLPLGQARVQLCYSLVSIPDMFCEVVWISVIVNVRARHLMRRLRAQRQQRRRQKDWKIVVVVLFAFKPPLTFLVTEKAFAHLAGSRSWRDHNTSVVAVKLALWGTLPEMLEGKNSSMTTSSFWNQWVSPTNFKESILASGFDRTSWFYFVSIILSSCLRKLLNSSERERERDYPKMCINMFYCFQCVFEEKKFISRNYSRHWKCIFLGGNFLSVFSKENNVHVYDILFIFNTLFNKSYRSYFPFFLAITICSNWKKCQK